MRRAMALTTVAVTALALGALANGGLKEKSKTFTVPGGETAEETVKCKKGQEAIAGGFAGTVNEIVPRDFAREGNRRWRLRSNNLDASSAGEATVDVICSKDQVGLQARTHTRTVGVGNTDVGVHCRGRRETVSGGFEIEGGLGPLVHASRRDGRREWIVKVNSEGGSFDVTAIVYCARLEDHLKETSTTVTLPNGGVTSATAGCKRRQRILSGGFEGDSTESFSELARTFASERANKRTWQVTGYGNVGSPELTVYAYCEKKERN